MKLSARLCRSFLSEVGTRRGGKEEWMTRRVVSRGTLVMLCLCSQRLLPGTPPRLCTLSLWAQKLGKGLFMTAYNTTDVLTLCCNRATSSSRPPHPIVSSLPYRIASPACAAPIMARFGPVSVSARSVPKTKDCLSLALCGPVLAYVLFLTLESACAPPIEPSFVIISVYFQPPAKLHVPSTSSPLLCPNQAFHHPHFRLPSHFSTRSLHPSLHRAAHRP